MACILTLSLGKFSEQLKRIGVDITDDKALRVYIYSLLERDLKVYKPTPTSKPSEEFETFTI